MPFSRIFPWVSIIPLIPLLIPTARAIPKMRASPQLNSNFRTTTIVSSSTTTFIAISTEYSTPATYPATSSTPLLGPPWATKPWFPPTYTWKKSETTGTTLSFYPTPANTSIRYSTLTGRPGYTTHEHSTPPPSLSALTTHSPQISGREIHPNWDSRWCLTVRARIFVDGTPVEMYAFLLSIHHSTPYHFLKSVVGVLDPRENTGNSGEVAAIRRSGQRKRISVWREKSVRPFRDTIKHSCM
jgi:hypothetical protein